MRQVVLGLFLLCILRKKDACEIRKGKWCEWTNQPIKFTQELVSMRNLQKIKIHLKPLPFGYVY